MLDLHTLRVIGTAFSSRPDAALVSKALEVAYEQRGRPAGVLFHSGRAANMSTVYFGSGCVAIA